MKKQPTIEIRRRNSDFHVQIKNKPEIWSCGNTIEEAIEDLKRSNLKSLFKNGIKQMVYLGKISKSAGI